MIEFNSNDPFGLFRQWMADAERSESEDPNAMALATADASGIPSVRMVLLKGIDSRGFVFYTNLESRKGVQLAENPNAALCFHWKSLRRQIRVEGPVEPVSDAEADEYYHSRPRGSQIGAWASRQSRPLQGRWELEKRVAEFAAKHAIGTIPRPPFWSGFRVIPSRIEFWHDRPFRLHDRVVFHRVDASPGDASGTPGDAGWTTETLFP
jgi:pyridoxamine 5'-phosphate oxidase